MSSENRSSTRGRHARPAQHTGAELGRAWWQGGRWWYLPLLLSDYARELVMGFR